MGNTAAASTYVDPSVYSVAEYSTQKDEYDTATDPGSLDLTAAKLLRNDMVWGLMTDIEIVYNSKYQRLFGGKNLTAVVGDTLTLGLGAAGSIATNVATKTIFSALNTAISGLDLSISKNYYAEQSFQVIGIAMQTRRDKIRAGIMAGLSQDVVTYPLNQAKRDLISYIQAGTLAAGLQELQEEAGTATAEVKIGATAPSVPSSPFANLGLAQNAVTWMAVPGATTYTVYYGTSPGVTKSNSKLAPATVNDIVHPNLVPGTTYYYAITASNSAGESDLSSEVHAQPILAGTSSHPNLPAPANLKVQMIGGAAVITFDAPTNAATFNVYKDTSSTPTTSSALSTGKPTNLYIDTAADASTHYYSVIAVDVSNNLGMQTAALAPTAATISTPVHKVSQYQLH